MLSEPTPRMSQESAAQASQAAPEQEVAHVLTASVHDIRYFAALLRGIQVAKVACVMVTPTGLIVSAEDARTLLGTAYIFADTFDEYTFTPEQQPHAPSQSSSGSQQADPMNAAFDINLQVLLECLNILGTAGSTGTSLKPNEQAHRFHKIGEGEAGPSRRGTGAGTAGRIDQYFGAGKGTGMRLSYAGAGYPLTLIIAEEADGPTATCEVTTFDT